MSPLNIYKASAGSGKTFALTLEYLVLLFRSPESYRHILAVTFTNKAAGEMKERILQRLRNMAYDPQGEGREDLQRLKERTGLRVEQVQEKSGRLLETILNDYSSFSVGTIDRFFQSVIRAFTREIGIQPAYNLELDNKRVLAKGVELLFGDIEEDRDLQSWLIRYAEERMEEARSWNFQEEIMELGGQLFSEAFQELFAAHGLEVLDRKGLRSFLEKLSRMEQEQEQEIRSLGQKAVNAIRAAGLEPDDFKGKSRSPAMIFPSAMEEGTVNFTDARLKSLEDTERWLTKDSEASMALLLEQTLLPVAAQIHDAQLMLNTIIAIRGPFYTLGILGDLQTRVQLYLKENNLFLISDSGRFLRGIVGGNQVPFIYERTGNRYAHIMLDEFQDTSVFQYDNFRPLLDNALASGHENLVVGDVKQSIYRWRNSDWRILAERVEADFAHQEVAVKTLNRNHRSSENVIRFNNSVFQLAARCLALEIAADHEAARSSREAAQEAESRFRNAYADAVQLLPPGTDDGSGAVRMHFLADDQENSFTDGVLEALPEWILEIQDHGVAPGEIAILVRTGREGVRVAEVLLEYARQHDKQEAFRLVSSDSLLLIHNESVVLLLSAMTNLARPEDPLNCALLKSTYISIANKPDLSGSMLNALNPDDLLPAAFSAQKAQLGRMGLYELVEALVHIFSLEEKEDDLPFIRGFQELVLEAGRREAMDLPAFLEYWKQKGSRQSIQLSERSNAIRIMTIHRSKGLEFKAVLIPFCNWEITTDARKSNILWCSGKGSPFDDLPLLPLKYSEKLSSTLFAPYYYQERMKGYLDSLNLMYVAFTRAREVLYVGLPDQKDLGKKGRLRTASELLHTLMDQLPTEDPCLGALSGYFQNGICSIGEMPPGETPGAKEDFPVLSFRGGAYKPQLPDLRIRSDSWLEDGEEGTGGSRLFGNMMHLLFSRIQYCSSLNKVMDSLQEEGLIPPGEKQGLQKRMEELLNHEVAGPWFREQEGRRILNERGILAENGTLYRPDRVVVDPELCRVIDFKFGKQEQDSHRKQVLSYKSLLENMGYNRVEAWLWYVSLNRVIKVEEA